MSTLTNTKNMTVAHREEMHNKMRLGLVKVLDHIPTAIIMGLIALYYIQLSHMG